MEFIENLKTLLIDKKISKNKLAKEIGISEGTIRSWETGKFPTIDKLIKISQYFSISTDELLGLTKEEYTSEEQKIIDAYNKADKITQGNIKAILQINEEVKNELSATKIG